MRLFISKHSLLFVTVLSFFAALLLQSVWWWHFNIIDSAMWAKQGIYLMEGDPQVFDFFQAYAHPGGTIMVGTLLLGKVGFTSDIALRIFLSLCGASVIAAAALCSYILRRDHFWVVGTVILLSIHKLYFDATPTTAIAAPLVVLLVLYTLVLYERRVSVNAYSVALWGAASGFLVATRADIGGLTSAIFFIPMMMIVRLREAVVAVVVAVVVFFIMDPFMWFMPVQHIFDLIAKLTMHYSTGEVSSPTTSSFTLVDMTLLTLVSGALLTGLQIMRVKLLPRGFIFALVTFTGLIFSVLLTAEFQTPRYFMPVVLVWEVFLAHFLFVAVDRVHYLTSPNSRRLKLLIKSAILMSLFLVHFMVFYLRIDSNQSFYSMLFL